MPYIGYNVTNAGSFAMIDDISSTFNGSNTSFTLNVGGVNITPNTANLLIAIDGVVQQAPDAYTVSGSTINFTGAPASGADFYGILMGQSSYVENNSIGADELNVSGDGTSGQVLTSDGDGTFSWATDTEAYVPLAGGTMTGTLAMGSNDITGTGDIGGTLTTASQPNITSVGTLSALAVTGTTTFTGSGDFVRANSNASNANCAFALSNQTTLKWSMYNNASNNSWNLYDHAGSANVMTVTTGGNATFAGELRVNGGQASIYGAEGGNAILELNSDEADDNADRWQMFAHNTSNFLKFREYSTGAWVDRLWIGNATDNWGLNFTGNSPYGMQITTTSDGSSSHDAFVIKRDGNNKVFEIFNNGTLTTYGGGTATFAGDVKVSGDQASIGTTTLEKTLSLSNASETLVYFQADNDGNQGWQIGLNSGATDSFQIRRVGSGTSILCNPDRSVVVDSYGQNVFQAKSTIASDAIFKFTKSTVNGGASNLKIQGYRNTGTSDTAILSFDNNTTTCARIYMKRVDDNSGQLVLGTGDSGTISDYFTMDNAGSITITSTVHCAKLQVTGTSQIYGTGDYGVQVWRSDTGIMNARFYDNGDYSFRGSDQSDKDLKKNIVDIPDGSLALVNQLKPKTYKWKVSQNLGDATKTGFIAQNVAEVFGTNESVATGTDGNEDMGINPVGLIAHLTKAVQELSDKVEALENA